MHTSKGFVPIFLVVVIAVGVFATAGVATFYIVSKNKADIAESAKDEEAKRKAAAFEKEREELDKKILELEAKMTGAASPSKAQKEGSQDFTRLRAELDALKQQKTQVVEKIATIETKNESLTNKEIINKLKPAVVYIEVGTDQKSTGTGFIYRSDGYILTNSHVLAIGPISVKLSDGTTAKATSYSRNKEADVAIIKIDGSFSAAELGDSNSLEPGDDVFALGYPFGLQGSVSFKEGTFSRSLEEGGVTYLETSVDLHPGNSGGPLVNRSGKVVGINTAGYGRQINGITVGETIKLSTSINDVKKIISELEAATRIPKPYTEEQFRAYGQFSEALNKNIELVEKAELELVKFSTAAAAGPAQERVSEAISLLSLAKAGIKRMEDLYPAGTSLASLARQVLESQSSYISNLSEAANYGLMYVSGHTTYKLIIFDIETSLQKAINSKKQFTELKTKLEDKATEFFD